MKCCGLWYGGTSYGNPDPEKDLEHFSSLKMAKIVFDARTSDCSYPCVSNQIPDFGGPEMAIYWGDDPCVENGPDLILSFGPRGGARTERC